MDKISEESIDKQGRSSEFSENHKKIDKNSKIQNSAPTVFRGMTHRIFTESLKKNPLKIEAGVSI